MSIKSSTKKVPSTFHFYDTQPWVEIRNVLFVPNTVLAHGEPVCYVDGSVVLGVNRSGVGSEKIESVGGA